MGEIYCVLCCQEPNLLREFHPPFPQTSSRFLHKSVSVPESGGLEPQFIAGMDFHVVLHGIVLEPVRVVSFIQFGRSSIFPLLLDFLW